MIRLDLESRSKPSENTIIEPKVKQVHNMGSRRCEGDFPEVIKVKASHMSRFRKVEEAEWHAYPQGKTTLGGGLLRVRTLMQR